jgi:Kef-type K+ transport system membrane component KefB
LIPVFFVASGVRLDLQGLVAEPSALLRVPVLLLALLLVRGVPALLYARTLGWPKTLAAGLLQATSLPFLVTAATIGIEVGTISPTTGAALVCAGLLSMVLFPSLAVSRLRERSSGTATTDDPKPDLTASSPDGPAHS